MTKFYTRTHNAPYECGSDTFGDARRQIGLNFYNYGLSFIIFDIEIIFLLPAAPSFVFFSFTGRCFFMLFVILLIVGYRYELKHNFLNIKD
jgi:NADH-quinone oxidoreductase subunit A